MDFNVLSELRVYSEIQLSWADVLHGYKTADGGHCSMMLSYLQVIGEALEAYTKRVRIEWVTEWPGQSVLAVTQKFWTSYIHEAINKGGNALREYLEVNNDQINDIVTLVRGKLSKQNRTTLQVKLSSVVCSYFGFNIIIFRVCSCLSLFLSLYLSHGYWVMFSGTDCT